MPTYQYACRDCDHSFEQVQSFSEDALTVCPRCEGRLRKIFNAVGVVFKGSGFYRTDSRTDGRSDSRSDTKSGSNGSAGAGKTESSGSDSTSTSTASSGKSETPAASGSAA